MRNVWKIVKHVKRKCKTYLWQHFEYIIFIYLWCTIVYKSEILYKRVCFILKWINTCVVLCFSASRILSTPCLSIYVILCYIYIYILWYIYIYIYIYSRGYIYVYIYIYIYTCIRRGAARTAWLVQHQYLLAIWLMWFLNKST